MKTILPYTTRFVFGAGLLVAVVAGSPARADSCDDLARQLASNVDGLKVGKAAGGAIYMTHPLAKQVTLGCPARNMQASFAAVSEKRKPSPEFLSFVASAATLVFTIPKSDMDRGVKRCAGRMGLLRGDTIATRYRRLDIRCTRTRTNATIAVSREKD